jgi:hypothetical protein
LIQVQAAFALDFFRIFRGAKKSVSNHGQGGSGGATHCEHEFPIRGHGSQARGSCVFVARVLICGEKTTT